MAAALGAAVLLITRTLEPRKLYEEVDWGLLVFFVGLFLIVGGAQNAGIIEKFLGIAEHWNLHNLGVFTVAVSLLSNIVSNVPAVMLLKSLAPKFANPHEERGTIVQAFVVLRDPAAGDAVKLGRTAGLRQGLDRPVQVPAGGRVRDRAAQDDQREDPALPAAAARRGTGTPRASGRAGLGRARYGGETSAVRDKRIFLSERRWCGVQVSRSAWGPRGPRS